MRFAPLLRGAAVISAAGLALAFASPAASASVSPRTASAPSGIANAVFVQSNATTGNQILAYSRSSGGGLSFVRAYDTGGLGAALNGAVVDKLASQGSLVYDAAAGLLVAVNAGSGTITTFAVNGDRLSDRHILRAGTLPVSIAAYGDLVYVLDAGGAGSVTGFRLIGGHLSPIGGSTRGLGLTPGATPQYLNTPGQVGFSPDGSQLVVTTKANGSDIDVFGVGPTGRLSATPTVNASATPVPFGFVFDSSNRLVVTEAGSSHLSAYTLAADGTVTPSSTVTDGQAALCWVTRVGAFFFGANAGSADLSSFSENGSGQVVLDQAIAAKTDAGPIDLAASSDGAFLYTEAGGAGAIDEFAIASNGSLTSIGSVTGVSGTGIEGIVAA